MKRKLATFAALLMIWTLGVGPHQAHAQQVHEQQSTVLVPTVQLGDHGPQVVRVQFILISHGYAVGPADGRFGARTLRAVLKWQHANGLRADGIVGNATWGSLERSTKPRIVQKPSAAPQVPKPTVSTPQPQPAPDPAPVAAESGDVEGIIRAVWPDDLEDHALAIVSRETGRTFDPTVINRNGSATGLFQIMWFTHRGWLCPEMGICAQSQLQDADTNARAAYALYQRARGWGPWAV